jgi:ankyrin repeat protein
LLWVSADPGYGKSVLAKSLVDTDLMPTESRTTCYFFFKDDNADQKSITNALSALLHQLFSRKSGLLKYAIPEFESNGPQLPHLFDPLWRILTSAAEDPAAGEIICIFDALDECEEQGRFKLIDALKDYYHKISDRGNNSALKFLVTSRPYFDIERRFMGLTKSMPSIRLAGEEETESVRRDIDLVIRAKVQEMVYLNKSTRLYLAKTLWSIEHRTYLWLNLIFESIHRSLNITTERKIRNIIDTMPDTVDKAYEAILDKTTDEKMAKKLLHIIVSAVRPLTLREANIALAIEDDSKSFEDLDLEPDHTFQTTVRNLCGLFVSVIDSKIYLIHQTAKEFLVRRTFAAQPAKLVTSPGTWKHSLEPAESNLVLAKICISYLRFPRHIRNVLDQLSEDRKSDFLGYASIFWAQHFREAKTREGTVVFNSAIEICNPQSKWFQIWFPVYWRAMYGSSQCPKDFTDLMVSSYFGHEEVVKMLLPKVSGVDVNFKDSTYGRTALSWASRRGHVAVVTILLEKWTRVDVNSKDCRNCTPLLLAASNGHEGVVEALLREGTGVDVNSRDFIGDTPLWCAVQNGHVRVVEALLRDGTGVDVNSRDSNAQKLLWWAVRKGHGGVVAVLLREGTGVDVNVDVDSQDRNCRTLLSWASEKGDEKAVEELLEKGASADLYDFNSRTPLSWAAEQGRESVVAMLQDRRPGLDVNFTDYLYRSPLWWAAKNGHKGVVAMLLDNKGIDVDCKDLKGTTPLLWAACNGHSAVVTMLLDKGGVDVNWKDSNHQTPLSWAARNGYEAVVATLLKKGPGVDVNSKDWSYQTPLCWAARNGHCAVVAVLLDYKVGADVNSKDSDYGRTPLSWAAGNGHEEVVVKLLQHGGGKEVNSRDLRYGLTAQEWADKNSHDAVVALLAPR